jgi:hypothetical protein
MIRILIPICLLLACTTSLPACGSSHPLTTVQELKVGENDLIRYTLVQRTQSVGELFTCTFAYLSPGKNIEEEIVSLSVIGDKPQITLVAVSNKDGVEIHIKGWPDGDLLLIRTGPDKWVMKSDSEKADNKLAPFVYELF